MKAKTKTFFVRFDAYFENVYFYTDESQRRLATNYAYSACVDSLVTATGIPRSAWARMDTYTKQQSYTVRKKKGA